MQHFRITLSAFALAASTLACGQGGVTPDENTDDVRALEGTAPSSIVSVFAIDTRGRTTRTTPSDGAFRLVIDSDRPVHLFLEDAAGNLALLGFPNSSTGERQSAIPVANQTVAMGALSVGDSDADGEEDDADAEENPLGQIDSDDDGEADLDDEDDDDDGTDDAEDEDHDDSGESDDDEDLDSDDDGECDLDDDDDDNDGVDDEDDEDEADDADGDGVEDGEDEDDDNDGEDDDSDDDDDEDGVDDEDETEEEEEDDDGAL
jgi:hypothetical protein